MSAPTKEYKKSRRQNRRRYAQLIALSKPLLILERLWPCLWQPAAVAAVITGIGFTGILTTLPLWLHTLAILMLAGGLCIVSSRSFSTFQIPDHGAVVAWIEHGNSAQNRPLATVKDTLSSDPSKILERHLWQEHRKRISRQARRLRIPKPRLELATHDPFALRSVAILILLIGTSIGWNDLGARLYGSLIPTAGWQGPVVQIDAWINPPGYTGHSPLHLSADRNGPKPNPATDDNAHPVPVGSNILVQVASDHKPALKVGNRTVTFETLGKDGYRADIQLEASDTIAAKTDLTISIPGMSEVRWPVYFVDDLPPVLDFNNPPEAASHGRMSISFSARDDFGLEDISLVVHNTALPDDGSQENLFRVNLPLPRAGTLSISTIAVKDLSAHEWAGLPVALSLEARDAIGQIGRSGILQTTLPERSFNHPVAAKLAEYRKNLWFPEESTISGVISGLGGLSLRPADFNHDTIAFLAMRVASARLRYLGNGDDASSVRNLLWETALRIEDGEFAVAGRELTDAHKQLMDALNNGTYGEQIEHLLNALQEALERFMAALSEQLTQKGLDSITDLPGMAFMDNADILEMLEDARELARTGSVEAAQQVLEQLRAMLESVENAMNEGVPVEQYNATREMLQEMFDLTRDQESLLDDTFRQVRKASDPRSQTNGDNSQQQQSRNPYESHADTQERIRQSLRKLMPVLARATGIIPGPAIEAERSMQGSSQSLLEGKGDDSITHQSDALDALRRMSERLADQMAQQLQGMPGGQAGAQGLIPGGESDPFGRAGNGGLSSRMDDGTVKIPTEFEILRAREIFDELRRRSNDQHRPVLERQYIERLLRPF